METPAEDIDSLLEEIPRATSAPPQFNNSSQASPASCLPEVLFERKVPTFLSDSRVMFLAGNPNPNPNISSKRSSNPCPCTSPRIPPVSLKQHKLAAFQERLLPSGNEPLVGNALTGLSLRDEERNCFHRLVDSRNMAYTPNGLMQDFSGMRPASSASYVNPLRQISRVPAPSFTKGLSIPASPSSTMHPRADANLLDQSHLQEGQMNHQLSPTSNASTDNDLFCMKSRFLEDGQPLSLRAKNILIRPEFEKPRAKQLASQQGYEWNSPLQKGSYFGPPVAELRDLSALPLSDANQPGCTAVNSKDLYEICLTRSASDFTPGSHTMSMIRQQKLPLVRHSMEEQFNMKQLQSGLNASLHDHRRYAKTPAEHPTNMAELKDLQYTIGSILPANEHSLYGNDTNFRLHGQQHWICGRNCPSSHPVSYREDTPSMHSCKESFGGAAGLYDELGALAPIQGFQCPETNGNYNELTALTSGRSRMEQGGLLVGDGLLLLEEGSSFKSSWTEGSESLQQILRFTNLQDLEGQIFGVAKDQHGCRFLQRMLDEAKPENVEMIFREIQEHVVLLMTDPFGNYLVQKLLDCCSESHCTAILEAVTESDDLISISLNMHGTRAVQKLIETLQTPDQIAILTSCLKRGVVTLIKDLNGNHVVQRCLQRLGNDDNQFIFDAAASHCIEIASHRHGCCVLQRCVDFASNVQQHQLVSEIAANGLALSQDQFGNYVVQYILDLGLPWAVAEVISRIEGSFPDLAMQKFSSNVVEKCLKVATEEGKSRIIQELVSSSLLSQLCQDPYANYVIQSALQVSKGHLHSSIIDAIKPLVHDLRNSPYGKRILSRMQFKK